MKTLAPDADAWQQLLGAGTCEFLTTLKDHPEFPTLDAQYGIKPALEVHALNSASPQHVPALIAFSKILSTNNQFPSLDPKVLDQYHKLILSRPMSPEKLTSLGIVLSNSSNPTESAAREKWFDFSLNAIIVPYIRDPTMQLTPITLLSALSGHVWGVKRIAESAQIMEWLQDRLGGYQEATGKFAVVKRMLGTTLAEEERVGKREEGLLGRWRFHVEVFVSRGEWWRDPAAEVATEGS